MTDPLAAWLNEMEAKCRAATPGPWEYDGKFQVGIRGPDDWTGFRTRRPDAAYIAALPPETVSALIECVRALSVPAILDALAQAYERHDQNGSQFHATAVAVQRTIARLRKLAGREG